SADLAVAHMLHAMALVYLGSAEAALAESERAMERAAESRNVLLGKWAEQQKASALSQLGRHDAAIATIRQVVAFFAKDDGTADPSQEVARRQLGEFLARARRAEEAQSVLAENLSRLRLLYPNGNETTAQTEDLLGVVARMRGDHASARLLH